MCILFQWILNYSKVGIIKTEDEIELWTKFKDMLYFILSSISVTIMKVVKTNRCF